MGNNGGVDLYCTGVVELLKHCGFFDASCKQLDQLTVRSDVDGRVGQNLAVAVPAAVGGGAAASRVVSADLAEELVFAVLLQVQV